MKFLYVLCYLLLLVSFICLKTSNNKRSIITSIIYTIAFSLCFNVLIVYINYYLKIGSSLLVLSIINFLLSIIFIILIKKRGRQEYYYKKEELYGLLIISFILLIVCLFRFNLFRDINYESGDSSIHYKMAMHFKDSMNLLDNNNSTDIVYSFGGTMSGYYINAGLFIKLLDNFSSYKVYMLFDSLFFMLLGCLFLVTIYSIKKEKLYLNVIVTLLYSLGYPLNNLIFGFGYLGMGILTINMLFLTYNLYFEFKDNIIYKNILLFIINFALFFSYYLFVPVIYLSEGLYYLITYFKKKISFKILFIYLISLILPFVLGFIYFIIPSFNSNPITLFKDYGYIYSGILCPLVLIFIIIFKILKINNCLFEKLTFYVFLYVLVVFSFLLFFCNFEYYYYLKFFYVIWLVCFILFVNIFNFNKIKKYLIIISVVIVCLTSSIFFVDELDNVIANYVIYTYNFSKIKTSPVINKKELEIINESLKYTECVESDRFYVSSYNSEINLWYYAITNRIPNEKYNHNNSRSLQKHNVIIYNYDLISNKCLIYLYRSNSKLDTSIYDKLYENEAGVILKKRSSL